MTASPELAASSRSPSSGTANSMPRNGCTSCIWLTRTVPPRARPRYQAKKPSHMENTDTYARAAQAAGATDAAASGEGAKNQAAGSATGSPITSAQQITAPAGMRCDRRPPMP